MALGSAAVAVTQTETIDSAHKIRLAVINYDCTAHESGKWEVANRKSGIGADKIKTQDLRLHDTQWDKLDSNRDRDSTFHRMDNSARRSRNSAGRSQYAWIIALLMVILWGAQRFT